MGFQFAVSMALQDVVGMGKASRPEILATAEKPKNFRDYFNTVDLTSGFAAIKGIRRTDTDRLTSAVTEAREKLFTGVHLDPGELRLLAMGGDSSLSLCIRTAVRQLVDSGCTDFPWNTVHEDPLHLDYSGSTIDAIRTRGPYINSDGLVFSLRTGELPVFVLGHYTTEEAAHKAEGSQYSGFVGEVAMGEMGICHPSLDQGYAKMEALFGPGTVSRIVKKGILDARRRTEEDIRRELYGNLEIDTAFVTQTVDLPYKVTYSLALTDSLGDPDIVVTEKHSYYRFLVAGVQGNPQAPIRFYSTRGRSNSEALFYIGIGPVAEICGSEENPARINYEALLKQLIYDPGCLVNVTEAFCPDAYFMSSGVPSALVQARHGKDRDTVYLNIPELQTCGMDGLQEAR
jgi:hypothetical protein